MTFLNKIKKFSKKITKTVDKLEEKYEVSEKFDSLKSKAGDLIDDVQDKVGDLNEKYDISGKLEDAKDAVVEKAGDLKDKAVELKDDVSDKIEAVIDDKITFDDFAKVELKLGKILEAEEVKKSKKLLKLKVDFGEEEPRQIISGIKEYYSVKEIKGKKALFATNLLPRKIMGLESNGMILGLQGEKEFSVLIADKKKLEEGVKAG